jgi:hypothetical protein
MFKRAVIPVRTLTISQQNFPLKIKPSLTLNDLGVPSHVTDKLRRRICPAVSCPAAHDSRSVTN